MAFKMFEEISSNKSVPKKLRRRVIKAFDTRRHQILAALDFIAAIARI